MKLDRRILLLSVLFGILAYVVDALVDWHVFYRGQGTFLELLLLSPPAHEIYIRLLLVACFAVFGVIAARITEKRRAAETAARQDAQQLAVTLASIGDAVLVTDAQGRIRLMNPVAETLTGWPLAEARGRPLAEVFRIVNSRTRTPAENPVERVLREGVIIGLANHTALLGRDGREHQIADSAAPIRENHGPIVGVVLVFRDVTAAYAQEESVRASEARFRNIIANAPMGVHLYELRPDNQLVLVAANAAADRLTGTDNQALLGKRIEDAFPGLVQTEIPDRYRCAARDGKPWQVFDVRYDHGGIHGWYDVHAFQTAPNQVAVMFLETTARRDAESALAEERARAEEYLRIVPSLVVALDATGTVTLLNDEGCRILGCEQGEALGRNWFDTFVPEEMRATVKAVFGQLMAGDIEPVTHYENPVLTCGGEERQIRWYNRLLRDTDGRITGTLSSGQDITEILAMEGQLRHAEKMTAIGQLAGGIAHDFNNLLAGILGYAEMLTRRIEDPHLSRYADNICKAARRAADLTGQLLAFARKGRYQAVPVNLHRVIADVVEILEHTVDRRIHICQRLEANPPMTMGDPTQLQTALLNIALNARDAMPGGGELTMATDIVRLDDAYCRTHPYEIQPGQYVRVSITDTGSGMDKETQKRIFEPFFTTKAVGKGIGMGLAAVYGTAKNHRGAVTVYSEPGHGSTFRLCLPLAEAEEPVETSPAQAATVPGVRILVVDDEEVVRTMAADLLVEMGHTVTTCGDGREAVNHYREHSREIDLVILDMVMPALGGRDTFRELKKINPSIRALLASGYSLNGEAQEILDEGVLAFVQKPFNTHELATKIALALE